MSTRLKRKLGDLGVDPSSPRVNENFCLIGTPLPPLEKSKDTGEFVPLWKQDVRDEQGRRRLHGAFTGGFSAGYFNTVGSKEGWTPSTFVSSRSDRARNRTARPEDFMDEEDLAELKESQNLVDTNEEMDLLGGTQAEVSRRNGAEESEQDSVARALESSMLPPPKDSIGARILKKMGWRIGQGIGPRVTYRQRKMQDLQASSTGATTDDIGEDDDEEAKKHMYAPRDTPLMIAERKGNSHGLGYEPGMGLNESLGVQAAVRGPNLAAGFGLGALNDADDDDVDVYDGDHKRSRTRTAYDASDREDDSRMVLGGKPHPNSYKTPVSADTSTFHDGQRVLTGFVLSDKPVAEDRWYPLPDVPKGWSPNPKRVWEKHKENSPRKENEAPPQLASTQPASHAKWKSGISADERGSILGETPLPSAPKSVFDYMSQKDRERLKNMTSSSTSAAAEAPPESVNIPRTEPHIAQLALRGFQPFTSEPAKQSRYTAYLNSQAIAGPPLTPSPGQSIENFNREVADFAKSAQIFKPLGGAMAGRFTSASIVEHDPKVIEGLHTPSANDPPPPRKEEKKDETEKREDESPKAHAARMGMYGRLTREVKPWMPAKLLCKRFGVKDPNPPAAAAESDSTAGSVPTTTQDWQPEASAVPAAAPPIAADASFASSLAGKKDTPRDMGNIGLGEDERQGGEILTYKRPTMDIFKAIFASDDEGSGEENDKDEKDDEGVVPATSTTASVAMSTTPTLGVQPKQDPAPAPATEDKIDIGTFKPTFIPRTDRPKKDKDKKERKKSGKPVLVSFELDDDGGALAITPKKDKHKDRPKKKKRKDQSQPRPAVDEDDGMWVEKPPPEAVKHLSVALELNQDSEGDRTENSMELPRGRKRAIDFM